ncbi:MAG: hypothetical protein JNK64_30625 [Myxococcales bacterium]|nr:hypothetical protein [Myxococcales bacterium]
MKLRRASLWFVSLILGVGLATAAPLDKKQASTLKRAQGQITNVDQQLDRAVSSAASRGGLLTERVEGDLTRRIQKLRELLATLPTGDAGVAAEAARLKQLEAKLAAKIAARQRAEAQAQAAADGVRAQVTAPRFAADLAKLAAWHEMTERAEAFDVDHYLFARWVDHPELAQLIAWGRQWAQAQREYAALKATYAAALVAKPIPPVAQELIALREVADEDADAAMAAFGAQLAAFVAAAPARIDADGKALAAAIAKARAGKQFNAILDPDGEIQGLRNRLVNLPAVYASLVGKAEGDQAIAAGRAAEDAAAAAIDGFAAELVNTNRAPDDLYAGDERAALEARVKAAWKKAFPTETVLAVRLRGEAFARQTSWTFDPAANAMVKRDVSTLPLYVVVKRDAKEAVMWPAGLVRDHMRGDTTEVVWLPRPSRGPSATQRMLLTNLK